MGALLASEALSRGHRVTVVSGPSVEPLPRGAKVVPVESAEDMRRALLRVVGDADVLFMAAAVCDFRPARVSRSKLHRNGRLRLMLEPTPDVVGSLPKPAGHVRIGFAVESDDLLSRAKRKLKAKRLDALLAQKVTGNGAPFGKLPVKAWLLSAKGSPQALGVVSKGRVARLLLDKAEALWYRHSASNTRPRRSSGNGP